MMVITIKNPVEWHARTRAQFVETAKRFASEVNVSTEDEEFNGKSVLSLMRLSVPVGMMLSIKAEGDDAADALQALHELLEHRFGENNRLT
jgi:phosphocarrier protein HPr